MSHYTFGQLLRAYRLGFFWSEEHGIFIRLSTPNATGSIAEVAPPDCLPIKSATVEHRVCDTEEQKHALLRASPAFEAVRLSALCRSPATRRGPSTTRAGGCDA